MVSALVYHPIIMASVVLLVVAAYLLKTGKRHRFTAHYAAGISAFSLFLLGFPIGLYEVASSGGLQYFPEVLLFHFANFFVAAALLITQTTVGIAMLLLGRRRRLYAFHKRLSKYVVVVMLIQAMLGLAVFIGILSLIQ